MLGVWQATIVNEVGDIRPGAQVEVRLESSGGLAPIWSDRDGGSALGNPFMADSSGFARFYAATGTYKITASLAGFEQIWRDVLVIDPELVLALIPES